MNTYIEDQLQTSATRITYLLQALSTHTYAKAELDKQSAHVSELENQLHVVRRRLSELEGQQSRAQGRRGKNRHHSAFRRFTYTVCGRQDAYDAKVAQEGKDALDGYQEVIDQKGKLERLDATLDEARSSERKLERAAKRHLNLQSELDALYDSIFGGSDGEYPYPDEARLRLQAEAALTEYEAVRQEQEKEEEALDLLQRAARRVGVALDLLADISPHRELDIVGHTNLVGQAFDGARSAAAQKEWRAAIMLHTQARQASGHVEPLQDVKVEEASLIASLASYGGSGTNIDGRATLGQSEWHMKRAAEAIQSQLQAAKERISARKGDMQGQARRLEVARSALQGERTNIFRRVTGKGWP